MRRLLNLKTLVPILVVVLLVVASGIAYAVGWHYEDRPDNGEETWSMHITDTSMCETGHGIINITWTEGTETQTCNDEVVNPEWNVFGLYGEGIHEFSWSDVGLEPPSGDNVCCIMFKCITGPPPSPPHWAIACRVNYE